MKTSEARILIYISQVRNTEKNVSMLSTKLKIGYNYLGNILRDMIENEWLFKHKLGKKVFYDITQTGRKQLKVAKEVLK